MLTHTEMTIAKSMHSQPMAKENKIAEFLRFIAHGSSKIVQFFRLLAHGKLKVQLLRLRLHAFKACEETELRSSDFSPWWKTDG